MSKEIDERVVSMQFDNALFEKNIQKSLKSIDDLNKSLNNLDGAKGFDELNKAVKQVDMTPLIASAKNAEKSFSALEIAGITTISRLTNSLIDFGAKMGKNFWNSTIGQIKSGGWKRASDIKAGKFMLEGLGLGDKNVELLSEAAQKAVKGTAAGLGEAMKAAGVMATSGLKDAQKMETTLRGIAGVSAMTGRSFENIANIYSTVASNGKLMTMQLRQFSFAGINAASVLAKQLGKTEAEINDMVTKGKIDFETFSDAMSDAFGKHAEDANKTFEGSMANMKAALSRIGEKFATPFMDNAKDVFNVLRVFFDSVKDAMAPIHEDFANLMQLGNMFIHKVFSPFVEKVKDEEGNWKWIAKETDIIDNIVAGVRNLYSIIILIVKTLGDAIHEVFPPLSDSTKTFKEFTQNLMPTTEGLKTLKFAFKVILVVIKQVTDTIGTLMNIGIKVFGVFVAVLNKLIGSFGFLDDLTGGLFEKLKNFKLVETIIDVICVSVVALGAAIGGVITLIGNLINKLKNLVNFDGIKQIGLNIINGIITGIQAGFDILKKIWNAIITFLPESMEKALKIASPSKVMKAIGKFIIAGLVAGLIAGEDTVLKVLNGLGDMFTSLISSAISFAELIGTTLVKSFNKLIDSIKTFNKTSTDDSVETMEKGLEEVNKNAKGAVHGYDKHTAYGMQEITVVQDAVRATFVENNQSMADSQQDLADTVDTTVPTITDRLRQFVDSIDLTKVALIILGATLAGTVGVQLAPFGSALSKMTLIIAGIVGILYLFKKLEIGEALKNFSSSVDSFFKTVSESAEKHKDTNKVAGFLDNIVNMFRNFRENMVAIAAKAIAMSFAIAVIGLIINVTKLIGSLTNGLKKLVEGLRSLGKITLGFKETFTDKIVKISLAIAVIAIAVSQLSQAAESGKIWEAIAALGGILIIFTLLAGIIAFIDKKVEGSTLMMATVNRTVTAFAAMCVSLVGLSWILSKADFNEKMINAMIILGVILASIFGIMAFIGRKAAGNINVNVTLRTMLGLAAVVSAMGVMLTAVALAFSKFENGGQMFTAGLSIAMIVSSVLGMIALILYQLRTTEEFKGYDMSKRTIPNSVETLAALGIFLLALGGFMKLLSHVNVSNFGSMFVAWIMSLLTLIGTVHLISKHKDTLDKIATGIESMANSVLKIGIAMYVIAGLDQAKFDLAYERVLNIVITLQSILLLVSAAKGFLQLIFSGLIGLFNKNAGKKFKMGDTDDLGQTIWGFAIGLASIAAGLAILAGVFALMPEERLDQFISWTQGIIALLGTFAVITAVVVKNNAVEDDKKMVLNRIVSMAAIIGAISMLLISLVILSVIPIQDLIAPLIGVITMMGILGLVFKSLGRINKHTKDVKGPLIWIGIILGIFSIISVIAGFKPEVISGAIGVATGMFLIIVSLAAMMKALSGNLKIDTTVMGTLLGMVLAIAIIGGIIAALMNMPNVDTAFSIAVGLSAIILALAGAVQIMSGASLDKSLWRGLIIAAVALTAIAESLALLKDADPAHIMAIAGAMSLLMISMGLFISALGLVNSIMPITSAWFMSFSKLLLSIGATILMASVGISAVILTIAFAGDILTSCLERLEKVDLNSIGDGLKEVGNGALEFGVKFAGGAIAASIGIVTLAGALTMLSSLIIPAVIGIGSFLMIGMGVGIAKGEPSVEKAMATGCVSLIDIAKKIFDVHSPSGVFKWIGDMLMNGLNLGIVQKIPVVGATLEAGLTDLVNKCYSYSEKFEEIGDEWSKLPEVLLDGKIDGMFGGLSDGVASLSDIFKELGVNTDDMKGIIDEATESVDGFGDSADITSGKTDNLKNSLAQTMDMFSGFDDTANMTGKDVIRSFQAQIEGVTKWRDELESLSARGLGEVIIQDLESLGPQAYEKVHAFYTMTNSELAMMNLMYKQKLAIQNGTSKKITKSFENLTDDMSDTMVEGINDMGDEVQDAMANMGSLMMKTLKYQMDREKVIGQVADFRDSVADKIRSSMSIFEAVNEQEEIKAEELLENMKNQVKHVGKWATMITEMAAKGFDEGLVATLTDMGPQSYSKVAAFLSMNEEQIAEANRLYEASEQVPEYGADKIVKAFAQAGFTASMGLTDSFLEGLDPTAVEDALADLAHLSITTLLDELDAPPTALEIGENWAGDFAAGLAAGADKVEEASKKLADAADIEYDVNSAPKYNQGVVLTEEERKKAKTVSQIRNELNAKAARDEYFEREAMKQSTNHTSLADAVLNEKKGRVSVKFKGKNEELENIIKKYATGPFARSTYTDELITGDVIYRLGALSSKISSKMQKAANNGDSSAVDDIKYFNELLETAAKNADEDNLYGYVYDAAMGMAEQFSDPEVQKTAETGGKYISMSAVNGAIGGNTGGMNGGFQDIKRNNLMNGAAILAMGEVGAATSIGYAKGVDDEANTVMEAGENMANNFAGSFIIALRDNMASLMEAIIGSDEDITSPKIKPVIDGSDILGSIRSLFKDNVDLKAAATVDVSTKNRDKSVVDAINGISNKEVVDAVNDLRDLVGLFRNDATGLSVVMDTGALVGQLGRPMDQYLGTMSLASGRGLV